MIAKPKFDASNLIFMVTAHLLAVLAIVYMALVHFSWWTLGLGALWFVFCGIAITGGYHRLFAHCTYKANGLVRAFYLFFGAASVQNSAIKWCADHRFHHTEVDTDRDPYNIKRGFWWAHILWVIYDEKKDRSSVVTDLARDPLVRFQDRFYIPLAVIAGALLPMALGFLWGDALGALLFVGFFRLAVQWHATFAINSVAHTVGKRTFQAEASARDNPWIALLTLGEAYHNFHHRFPLDYRNGIRWFNLDPTKWTIWGLSKLGLTWDLRRTPEERIRKARLQTPV